MASVKLTNVKKIYDKKVVAVHDFNLEIKDKEFVVFVGPSGCGKSTTLRMIAGLEEISEGTVEIDGVVVNDFQPKDRYISMVFQNYALYPHLTVFENMAFPLRLNKVAYTDEDGTVKYRKMSNEEIYNRVTNAAEILGITDYLTRKPRALSGGQRQRVAIGRAMVRDSKVFLMDEPLSNLDAKLRVQMRSEIAKIHERVGATTIYVTHDQTEAMTMATRIVIMKDGHIQQIGTPKEVYNFPANIFVGGFIGSPAMNFLRGKYIDGKFVIEADKTQRRIELDLTDELRKNIQGFENEEVVLGIRPEDIYVDGPIADKNKGSQCEVECDVVELLGHELIVYGYMNGQRIIVKTSATHDIQVHDKIMFAFDMSRAHCFDPESTNRLVYKEKKVGVEETETPAPEAQEAAPAVEEKPAEEAPVESPELDKKPARKPKAE